MQTKTLTSLAHLSDADLLSRIAALAAREREATALLVAHLAELDLRGLHLQAGYGSLFAYCREVLALSEHEAYNRIEVARAARRFPLILDQLADGSLKLTAARLLAPHLTLENHREVLESARGKRKNEVEEIVARLQPRPDVAASVRKLPATQPRVLPPLPVPAGASGPSPDPLPAALAPAMSAEQGPPSEACLAAPPLSLRFAPPARSSAPEPLSPGRYKLQLTIGEATLDKLRLAKDLQRHAIPSGDDAQILDRALTALLADLAKKKHAATEQPRASRGHTPGSRHIPAAVKRAVWLRDAGRCAFVGSGGRRCHERAFLEYHHVHPYAAGGPATIENVQLRCARHNQYEARLFFSEVREGAARYEVHPQGSLEPTRSGTSRQAGGYRQSPLSWKPAQWKGWA